MTKNEALAVIKSKEWRGRTYAEIAKATGLSHSVIYRIRRELSLTSRPRKRPARPLTPGQQKLVADMAEMISVWASREANDVVGYEELLDVATDAVIVASRSWDASKQPGSDRGKNTKWRGYACNGIKLAFRRKFWEKRRTLRQNSILMAHPYQKWIVKQRLVSGVGSVQDTDRQAHETETVSIIPDPGDADTLFARFSAMTGIHRAVIEMLAGLDGQPRATVADVAEFFDLTYAKAVRLIEKAKQELAG